ncbi:unnamed protein product [Malus baccata var. baccata]
MADGLQNADGISNNKKRLLFSKSPLPSTDCEALLNARREGEGFRHRNHESPIEWCPEWHIVGSCNGLICLYDTDANSNGHITGSWSTREFDNLKRSDTYLWVHGCFFNEALHWLVPSRTRILNSANEKIDEDNMLQLPDCMVSQKGALAYIGTLANCLSVYPFAVTATRTGILQ